MNFKEVLNMAVKAVASHNLFYGAVPNIKGHDRLCIKTADFEEDGIGLTLESVESPLEIYPAPVTLKMVIEEDGYDTVTKVFEGVQHWDELRMESAVWGVLDRLA